ncbi:hypothetical protein K1T71_009716 [Dendrolimus kikuchii]|uniref:Uncharacterized protein n=1 Tax=Dendrolimus kikuchii TaxID=765133 RepID=A0ACC1CSH0_9NEOP|nr:hypothetical protein K1T71_009716 [Dendrolimus kikuchii]
MNTIISKLRTTPILSFKNIQIFNMSHYKRQRRPPPPPGLRGKEIGLYYRSLRIQKNENQKRNFINLTVPPAVLSSINRNLQSIENIAQKLSIQIPPLRKIEFTNVELNSSEIGPNETSYSNDECTEFEEKRIKLELCNEIISNNKTNPKTADSLASIKERLKNRTQYLSASSSKCEEFTIKSNFNITPITASSVNVISEDNQNKFVSLPLQGAGDYKYGYEDIITGTFAEKLEECLSNGIQINFNNKEINDLNLSLYEDYIDMISRQKYKKFMEFREKLPTYKKSTEILNTIYNNQIVLISGETGCGKSTQVPQILLDDAILNNRGANVKILVTQPRRIAASSLATRVSEERGEVIGQSVGYAIRLEKVDCRPRGSIVFCTTGILVAELEVNQGLTEYSHVILDEVHERDTHIDLSMCMLKKVLQRRKDLKLILMSATVDSEKLTSYFDNCPMLHIEGLAYPVQDIYLEDILAMTKYKLPDENSNNKKYKNVKPWHKHIIRKREAREMEKDIQYKARIGPWLESIKDKLDKEVYKTLQDSRIEELNIELIFELMLHICRAEPGAILVFLPGISDITKLLQMMVDSIYFPSHRYEIYPLHSKLPSLEQNKIFQKPPDNIRKIIIATNIAETSITIDDIVYVIDCGRIKYSGLNVEQNISTLKTEWISKANLKQRRGRAGRCQPGICYHLVTSFQAEQFEERLLPEMQRNDLLEPVLAIKKLRLGKALEAMNILPAVPAEITIESAVRRLQQCGALDGDERLTPLGWHMARLPVPPCAGKLLLLGALFGCLDRAASVAAVWGFKDPFQLVIGKEREVDLSKLQFAVGEPSDHVTISQAIIQWEACSNQRKRSFAYENFLSMNTLQLLSEMKMQFGDNLRQMGFLSSGDIKSQWENRNANNLSLFKAIIAASLYPNIGTVKWHMKGRNTTLRRNAFKIKTPEEDGAISLHPSSVLSKHNHPSACITPGANWLVYWMKQRSTDLFLFEVTFVYTLPLLFFGELNIAPAENPDDCSISIKTINVTCNRETTALLFRMRALLDQVLASKITKSKNSAANHSEFEEQVLEAVVKLITAEDERAEYLDDDDD